MSGSRDLLGWSRRNVGLAIVAGFLLICWLKLEAHRLSIEEMQTHLLNQRELTAETTYNLLKAAPQKAIGSAKPAGSEYTQTLVVATTSNVDINWIDREVPYLNTAVYYADDIDAPYHPPKNKGHEAMMYLTYIIDHYHNLSDTTIFIHPHERAWHNNELFDMSMTDALRHLSNEHVARVGFFNLRCHTESGCPDYIHPYEEAVDESKQEQGYFKKVWNELHGPNVPMPKVISAACCAQFAASRAAIQAISLEKWHHYRRWLLKTNLSDFIAGRIWEYTWHFILTGNPEVCPIMNYCYCDGYGLCFESSADIDSWLALKETEFLTRDRRMEYKARGMPLQDIEWHMSSRITKPLQQRITEAYHRGSNPATRARLSGRADKWKEGDGF